MCSYALWILFGMFFLYRLDGVPEKWFEKEHTGSYIYTELTVSGKDLKRCKNHRNVCVMDTEDCASKPAYGQDRFLNVSCRYHALQRSFACKWIYLNNVKAILINSFLFSQVKDFKHCPSIFTPVAAFNMSIISKDIIRKVEFISEAYTVSITAITQAPRPVITSFNATASTLNVTWSKLHLDITKCEIRYRCSITQQWAVDSLMVTNKEELEVSHVINGLQPFSPYSLTVACNGDYGLWSDWSKELQGMTLEAIPIAPPYVSFYVEPSGNKSTPQKLILIWRALTINVARGVILGYEVTYTPTKQTGLKRSIHTKNQKAMLEVTAEEYDLTVTAYNTAGQSPSTNLTVNAGVFQSLPRVKGLWASSEALSLLIRWETASLNVTEFAIEWFSFGDVSSTQWKRVNSSTFSTVLRGQIKPLKFYNISVYALYGTLCAPPETIQASLDCGTLLDIVQLQPVIVTKTSVTVQWVWQERSLTINVLQYRLVLSGAHEKSSQVVFPHQWQHSFQNLQKNVKYTVSIYGETTYGNILKANIEFTTPHFESSEIIITAVPILLFIFTFGIFSVLSRTVYKGYFFPQIANPGRSLIGHWLLNPPYAREAVMNVLKLEDFSVTNQLNEQSFIHIEPKPCLDRQSIDEDMTMSKMSLPDNPNTLKNSRTLTGFSEYADLPLLHANFGYVENCDIQQWS